MMNNNLNIAIEHTKLLFKKHKLHDWSVGINNRKCALGVCNYRKKTITYSSWLMPLVKENEIKNTVIHEVAHSLTPHHGHDDIWADLCFRLGGKINRIAADTEFSVNIHSEMNKQSKYTLTCPVCGRKHAFYRKLKKKYSCEDCSPVFNTNYILIVTQNY